MTYLLEDMKINVKIKLSALWVAVMFVRVYTYIFAFYDPEHLNSALRGEAGGILLIDYTQITQSFLFQTMIVLTIPILMVFLSLTLNANVNRWTNIILGLIHIVLVLFAGLYILSRTYFLFATLVQAVFLSLIVWYAWKWPTRVSI